MGALASRPRSPLCLDTTENLPPPSKHPPSPKSSPPTPAHETEQCCSLTPSYQIARPIPNQQNDLAQSTRAAAARAEKAPRAAATTPYQSCSSSTPFDP